MKIKKAALAAICLSCTLCVSACGQRQIIRDDSIVEIRFSWWGKDERNECTLDCIALFEERNSNISVKPEYSEYEGFKSKMDAEIYSETEADVMQLNYDWLYEYNSDSDEFYDLNELSDYIDLSNFTQDELECGMINDTLYALPISFNAVTFIYNSTLYSSYGLSLPTTWEELFDAAEVMSNDGVYPLELTEKNFWLCCCAYLEQTQGVKAFDENQRLCLSAENLETMLEFYKRLVDEGVSPLGSEFSRINFNKQTMAGAAAWASDCSYFETAAAENGFTAVIGSYPAAEDYISYGWYIKPSSLYAINKQTAQPQAAAMLVDALLNDPKMAVAQSTTKGVPVSSSAVETLEAHDMLTGMEYSAAQQIDSEDELEFMCPYLENAELIDAFTEAFESVYYGQTDIHTAALQLSEQKVFTEFRK